MVFILFWKLPQNVFRVAQFDMYSTITYVFTIFIERISNDWQATCTVQAGNIMPD